MAKMKNGTQNGNIYTNEGFQLEDIQLEEKENCERGIGKRVNDPESFSQDKPANVEKNEWGGGLEFLMACISTSVGLGNVWRFPFTAYENGGGAFLIPYIIILILVGKPFYYLEGLLGQFTNRSCLKLWAVSPAMKGLGYGQAYVAFLVVSYYCSLMALTLYYLVASMQSQLPWSYCRAEWDGICFDTSTIVNSVNDTHSVSNKTNVQSSAELYFRKIVLREEESIEDGIGSPSWELSITLLISWISIFLVLSKGVKTTGKAAYFLALFPYVIMIALLIKAATLEGAVNGIIFFVTPNWSALLQPNVWYAAITQCFFSLSVCFGPILTYSSYNNFYHRLERDVLIVTTLDTITSLMAGCTIFGILGNLAHEMGTDDVQSVVRGGTGLAFISYPDALSRFDVVPQLFAVLFFLMMFILGIGSAMALCNAVFNVLYDHFPKVRQWKLVLVLTIIGYLIGLVYITPGGQWFVTLVDYYGGTFVAIIIAVLEIITVFWIYGLSNFLNDVEFMLGNRPGVYWRICWTIITPILMIVILVYTFVTYELLKYKDSFFPPYAYAIGWILFAVGVLQIFLCMLLEIFKSDSTSYIAKIKDAFKPSKKEWGPKDEKIRLKWQEFVSNKNTYSGKSLKDFFFR